MKHSTTMESLLSLSQYEAFDGSSLIEYIESQELFHNGPRSLWKEARYGGFDLNNTTSDSLHNHFVDPVEQIMVL
jgi:hypothetical protein